MYSSSIGSNCNQGDSENPSLKPCGKLCPAHYKRAEEARRRKLPEHPEAPLKTANHHWQACSQHASSKFFCHPQAFYHPKIFLSTFKVMVSVVLGRFVVLIQ